jgi:CubicO group peptidase (beta-lactamase class C family)
MAPGHHETQSPDGRLRHRVAALLGAAGYGRAEPVVVGVQRRNAAPLFVAQGRTRTGEPLGGTTLVYTASLSKQITAACAALLARRGALDMDGALADWLPELPAWAGAVRLRHLVHHTGALPPDPEIAAAADTDTDTDHTSQRVIDALCRLPAPDRRPAPPTPTPAPATPAWRQPCSARPGDRCRTSPAATSSAHWR